MSLRTRLLLTLAGIAVLLTLPAVYGITQHRRLAEIVSVTRNRHASASLALGQLQATLVELDRAERSYIATFDPDARVQIDSALAAAQTHLDSLTAAGYAEWTENLPLDSIRQETARILALIDADSAQMATARFEQVKPLFVTSANALDGVSEEILSRSEADLNRARDISQAASATTLLALLIALVFTILLGGWLTRTVFTPMHRLGEALTKVADGAHPAPPDLPYDRPDEIGDLARSFLWMSQRLQELDRMKAEFMSIATHELKTPINVISGYAELLDERLLGEITDKQEVAVASIREQTRTLSQLVNELLDVSRLEAGGLRLEIQAVPVRDLIDSVQRAFDVLCRQKGIDLEVDIALNVPDAIPADAIRLRDQVLGNLMSNAIKFTPEGGSIRVSVRRAPDNFIVIEVSDTGSGIPDDQRPHIFDKYYQVGEAARSTGAGLGLAIANDVVEAHGGRIEVESEVGKGTLFRVWLPARPEQIPAAAAAVEGVSGANG
ncbi:MAG: HAMP domain-containing histidine kinase [Candidatus Cloacimonetes bacterium]|jgi:signal transduction histidine kinase|nr:HAMP domain-containing histidine kinase [Candidatus Cloacimonadota bacterium]